MYIPVTSVENAMGVSEALYRLSRPNPNPNDVTKYYCAWMIHPVSGNVVLIIPDNDYLPIHPDADEYILDPCIQPFIDAQLMPQSELDAVHQAIIDNKGQSVQVINFIPTYWQSLAKTEQQMQEEGWFGTFEEAP